MGKLTKRDKAEIAKNLADGWYDAPFGYKTFLRILDGAIAAGDAGLTSDNIPWCLQTMDHLKGLCLGCKFNILPLKGASTNCCNYNPSMKKD